MHPDILALEDAANRFGAAREGVLAQHSTWDKDDARLALFSKCQNVVRSGMTLLAVVRHGMTKPGFWESGFQRVPSEIELAHAMREAERFTMIGTLHGVFSCLESSVRIYQRALDPAAHAGATTEFKPLYASLLRVLACQATESLFDILRETRNVIHNNGVYMNRQARDRTVVHAGVTYQLQHGKLVGFVTWAWLAARLTELADALHAIVEASPLAAIPTIADPSTK